MRFSVHTAAPEIRWLYRSTPSNALERLASFLTRFGNATKAQIDALAEIELEWIVGWQNALQHEHGSWIIAESTARRVGVSPSWPSRSADNDNDRDLPLVAIQFLMPDAKRRLAEEHDAAGGNNKATRADLIIEPKPIHEGRLIRDADVYEQIGRGVMAIALAISVASLGAIAWSFLI